MDFWLRSATLQIGGNRYSMDDLAFDFEVPFEDSDELTTATVNAYNLSANTRNSIKKGDPVIINAGYEGDLGVIFVGQVSGLSHKHRSTEWTTKITATEALDQWLTAQVNKTYTKSIKAKAMVQDLLNIFGIEVGTFELAIDKEYPRGRVCKGKLKDVLKEIVVSDCKSRFLIRCGKIIINNPTDGVNKGYLLSPETGLLRTDEEKVVIEVEKLDYTSMDEQFLRQAIACVNAHIADSSFSRTDFVREMNTSRTVLTEKLKSLTGLTPAAFVLDIRLRAARELLEKQRHIRVSDLAYTAGFNDPKYFSMCFKKKFGTSPREYAEQHTSEGEPPQPEP